MRVFRRHAFVAPVLASYAESYCDLRQFMTEAVPRLLAPGASNPLALVPRQPVPETPSPLSLAIATAPSACHRARTASVRADACSLTDHHVWAGVRPARGRWCVLVVQRIGVVQSLLSLHVRNLLPRITVAVACVCVWGGEGSCGKRSGSC